MHPRRLLVMAHTGAGGFVHASIPLAAKAVEALGNQGGLWTTTVSYDAADINTNNLKKYDAIFLDSTTACFLDDQDPSVTAARRAAFLSFVRGGKGIAGIMQRQTRITRTAWRVRLRQRGAPAGIWGRWF